MLLDPGPLVAEIEPRVLDEVLARTTWVSLNAREAELWTGRSDASEAAGDVLARAAAITGVVLRRGSAGCLATDAWWHRARRTRRAGRAGGEHQRRG